MGLNSNWVIWEDEKVDDELVIKHEVPDEEGGYFRGKIYDHFVDGITGGKYTLYGDLTSAEVLEIAQWLESFLAVASDVCAPDALFIDPLRGYKGDMDSLRYLATMFRKFGDAGYGLWACW